MADQHQQAHKIHNTMIMTLEHPNFYPILYGNLPPGETNEYYVVDSQTGLAKPVSEEDFVEYALGGEMDEVMGDDPEDQLWHVQI